MDDFTERAFALTASDWQLPHEERASRIAAALRDSHEAGRMEGLEKAAKLVEEGREVRDPLDNYESTIMVDWEDMDKLAAAIRALGRKA